MQNEMNSGKIAEYLMPSNDNVIVNSLDATKEN